MSNGRKSLLFKSIVLIACLTVSVTSSAFDMAQPRISGFISAGATHNDNDLARHRS